MNNQLFEGFDVSRETLASFDRFAELIKRWNPVINLVSKASLADLVRRHFVDSLQLATIAPEGVDHWADLGSGGGFPGLIVAIYARQIGWPRRMTLVESDARKAVFLREAARDLSLSITVLNERVETAIPLAAHVISARAFAPLSALCGFAQRHLSPSGTAIFPKGAQYATEVAAARETWRFDVNIVPSRTDGNGKILVLKGITHV